MHFVSYASSALLLGQFAHAVPLLTPRLLPIVDGITCNIAGLQIVNPTQTLAALRGGAISAPSGLSAGNFEQLLLGCLGSGTADSQRHTNLPTTTNVADTQNGDPAAGNYHGFSAFSTNGPGAAADPASTGANGGPAADTAATNDAAVASDSSASASGDGQATPATDGNANAAAAANADAVNADSANPGDSGSPTTNTAEADPPASDPPASDPPAADAAPASAPAPAADSPATAPAADNSAPSDASASSTNNSSTADPNAAPPASDPSADAAAGASSSASSSMNPGKMNPDKMNPDGANGANAPAADANGSTAESASSSASASAPAPAADGAGATGNTSPFAAYNADAPPDSAADEPTNRNTSNFSKNRHTTSNNAKCSGMLCAADTVLPGGVAAAPELGMNGLRNGNPGGCPSGDVDACADVGM
ncbi:hypothetical protein PsYK624_083110 [Phanerochaete sordida]|uniref:Uncharacterized protein n=1 Tax=Phanerochaete sordida TaxID=48140 RepID=A0A9P3LF33_9APHY|nr:hypothetical protein PsYK624_083110 [Phanerochaete sordida]